MKNIYILIPFLLLYSCRSDNNSEESTNGKNTITGVWKKSKEIIYSGKDNSIIATYPVDDPCEKNSSTEFTDDKKVLFRDYYENSSGNCVQHPTEIKSYSYDNNSKKLTIDNKLYGEIIKITNSQLDTKVALGDENGDGVKDYTVEYGYK